MSEKGLDSQQITNVLMGVVDQTLAKMTNVLSTDAPQSNMIDIVEYEGRMRISGMEKFNAPAYISFVNFYLTPLDMDKQRAKGALVLYVDFENAGKLFKALALPINDDEDDSSMMEANGKFCDVLAKGLNQELSQLGYTSLLMSPCENYKNSVMQGIQYSKDQKNKVELSFFYWKHKAIVVELTLAPIPLKK